MMSFKWAMAMKSAAIIQLCGFQTPPFKTFLWLKLQELASGGYLIIFRVKTTTRKKNEMTAPVITEVSPSDGPFCKSSFVVSFFVPKENQANPPTAKGLYVQRWKTVYVAVSQFGGFVSDTNVGEEAAALQASIAGTEWSAAIEKSHRTGHASIYTAAQYNAPFEYDNKVNEIGFLFDI